MISLNTNAQLFHIKGKKRNHYPKKLASRVYMQRLDKKHTLLLNSLSGAIDIANNKEISIIRTMNKSDQATPESLYNDLFKRGYLFESKKEESKYVARIFDETLLDTSCGIGCHIFVTSQCNFECPYCFERNKKNNHRDISEGDVQKIFKAIEKIKRDRGYSKNKVIVKIFGGEPLIIENKNVILKIFQLCRKNGYLITLTTNGYNLDLFLDIFEKYRDRLLFVHTTLDGPKDIHDKIRLHKNGEPTFTKISKNIDMALKRGIPVLLRTNLDNKTVPHLKRLVEYYITMKWHEFKNCMIQLIPVFDICASKNRARGENKRSIYQKTAATMHYISKRFHTKPLGNFWGYFICNCLSKAFNIDLGYNELSPNSSNSFYPQMFSCPANRLGDFQFLPDGYIYPCVVTAGEKSYRIGRWRSACSFNEAKCRAWTSKNVRNNKPCKDCRVSTFCGGTCPSRNESCVHYEETLKAFIDTYKTKMKDCT